MHRFPMTEARSRSGRSRFKTLLTIVAAPAVLMAFTQWFACGGSVNNTTGLDGEIDETLSGGGVPDAAFAELDVEPAGPVNVPVGGTVLFTIRLLDGSGNPIPGEAFLNVLLVDGLELVRACGGEDRGADGTPVPDCAGLVPASHLFEDDGTMWVEVRGVLEGAHDATFAWPGCLFRSSEGGGCTDGLAEEPWPGPPFNGAYRDQVTVKIIVGAAAPTDGDGDGVADTDDDCPATPPNTPVDAHGCTDTDEDGTPDTTDPCPTDPTDQCNVPSAPPTAMQVAPGFYDFAALPATTFDCGTTSVGSATWVEAALEPDFHGVDQPVFETLFTGSQLFTSVGGMYDPATGEYLSSGSGSDGNFFSMSGFWTTVNGDPFFEGTLTEDRASCVNVFPVTLTRRASNPGPGGHVVSVSSSRSVQVGHTTVLDVKVYDTVGNLIPGSDPFVAATRSANNHADVEAITIVSKDEGTPGDGIVHYTIRGNFAAQAMVVYEYPGSPHDTTVVTVTP